MCALLTAFQSCALPSLSLSVRYAANALVITRPPNIIDFASTTSFLSMLENNMRSLAAQDVHADYKFIQMVISRGDESRTAHREIVALPNMVFGRTVMTTEIKTSAAFNKRSEETRLGTGWFKTCRSGRST